MRQSKKPEKTYICVKKFGLSAEEKKARGIKRNSYEKPQTTGRTQGKIPKITHREADFYP